MPTGSDDVVPVEPLGGTQWLERVGTSMAVAVGLLMYGFYDRLYLGPVTASPGGYLESWIDQVSRGEHFAPYQYRFLVPYLIDALRDGGVAFGRAVRLVDLTAIMAGTALGIALFRRQRSATWLAAGALWTGLIVIGISLYPKPETFPSYAALTACYLVLADRRANPLVLLPLAALLLGMRTDLVAALGAGFAVRSRTTARRRDDLATAALLVVTAGAATVALLAVFPDAEYEPAAGFLQLRYNADGDTTFIAVAALFLPFAPLLSANRRRIVAVADPVALALLAPLVAEVAVTAVVGRLDEIRIYLPFAWGTALGGAMLWRAALGPGRPSRP